MNILSDFFGGSQRRDLENARAQSQAQLGQGYNQADQQYQNASARYTPYAQQGGQANALYGNALGLNGVEAQKSFGANYAASDPFREQNADFANNALMRQFNARGMANSGTSALAVSRASLERGSQDYNNYLTRLQGQGQQGYQATGAQAQLDQGRGDLAYGYHNQLAGNDISYGNALAQSRSTGINNIIGLLGAGANVAGAASGIPRSNMGRG